MSHFLKDIIKAFSIDSEQFIYDFILNNRMMKD